MVSLHYVLLICLLQEIAADGTLSRSKRYLVFPLGGSFKMVIGIGIPIKLGAKQSMAIGWNLQMQYSVPTNITQLESYPPIYTRSKQNRDKRDIAISDRALFYKCLEDIIDNEGFHGRECILHSICENAIDSTFHDANGLYGQLLHIILTPNYGDGEIEPDLDPAYLEAQRAGEYGVECNTLYRDCNMNNGLLDLFSFVKSELS